MCSGFQGLAVEECQDLLNSSFSDHTQGSSCVAIVNLPGWAWKLELLPEEKCILQFPGCPHTDDESQILFTEQVTYCPDISSTGTDTPRDIFSYINNFKKT